MNKNESMFCVMVYISSILSVLVACRGALFVYVLIAMGGNTKAKQKWPLLGMLGFLHTHSIFKCLPFRWFKLRQLVIFKAATLTLL